MLGFLITAVIMFAFWFLLSGQTNPLFLFLGAVSSVLVARWSKDLLAGKMDRLPNPGGMIPIIAYLAWLMWQIVLSNFHVIYLVLHPKMPIEPQMVRFKNNLKSDLGIVTLANSITLTPGTITVEGNREEFIVHAVSRKTAEDLLSDEMQKRVLYIEGGGKELKKLYV